MEKTLDQEFQEMRDRMKSNGIPTHCPHCGNPLLDEDTFDKNAGVKVLVAQYQEVEGCLDLYSQEKANVLLAYGTEEIQSYDVVTVYCLRCKKEIPELNNADCEYPL